MEIAFETDQGKVRPLNEDNVTMFYEKEEDLLFVVVADGMGGHQAGEVASEIAVLTLKEAWERDHAHLTKDDFATWLSEQIKKTNLKIFEHAIKHQECKGMGTTIVAAICQESTVVISHVGDSRCYYMTNEELSLVTYDHTLVNELVKQGQITKEEAENHPRKNVIMRAVGTEPAIEVDTQVMNWNKGDYLLLCSDGLSDKVNSDAMKEVLLKNKTLKEKAKELINLANDAGGEDNITVAIIHALSEGAGEAR